MTHLELHRFATIQLASICSLCAMGFQEVMLPTLNSRPGTQSSCPNTTMHLPEHLQGNASSLAPSAHVCSTLQERCCPAHQACEPHTALHKVEFQGFRDQLILQPFGSQFRPAAIQDHCNNRSTLLELASSSESAQSCSTALLGHQDACPRAYVRPCRGGRTQSRSRCWSGGRTSPPHPHPGVAPRRSTPLSHRSP